MMIPFTFVVAFLVVLAGRAALHGRREQNLGSVSPQWLTEHQQRAAF
jgi:hypothetical protein